MPGRRAPVRCSRRRQRSAVWGRGGQGAQLLCPGQQQAGEGQFHQHGHRDAAPLAGGAPAERDVEPRVAAQQRRSDGHDRHRGAPAAPAQPGRRGKATQQRDVEPHPAPPPQTRVISGRRRGRQENRPRKQNSGRAGHQNQEHTPEHASTLWPVRPSATRAFPRAAAENAPPGAHALRPRPEPRAWARPAHGPPVRGSGGWHRRRVPPPRPGGSLPRRSRCHQGASRCRESAPAGWRPWLGSPRSPRGPLPWPPRVLRRSG